MSDPVKATSVIRPNTLSTTISIPDSFHFDQVKLGTLLAPGLLDPPLNALSHFTGTWKGKGFNTIFRPNSSVTPTKLALPYGSSDNILELNLTEEQIDFSKALGTVPNRGSANAQPDAFLNGVPYLQTVNDITDPAHPTGIHVEPGLWMIVPNTTVPHLGSTLTRMASIPHGVTIMAQGTSTDITGPPTIPSVDITPFFISGGAKQPFPSQKVVNNSTPRIPQNLAPFVAAGTITQAILDDPNSILRTHIAAQHILKTTIITISTAPPAPLFGGGTDNIAFLLGENQPVPPDPNANTVRMTATFWIETVLHTLNIPIFKAGQAPLLLQPQLVHPGQLVPTFSVHPPMEVSAPRTITFTSLQIQYTQTVFLNFKPLSWPHVSLATLVPSQPVVVPPTAWA